MHLARTENAEAAADLEAVSSAMQSLGLEWCVLGSEWLRADALVHVGRFDDALAAVDDNLARGEATGARYLEAELYRLRGEALAAQGSSARPDAEQCLRRAIAIAQEQAARWWELRARSGLVRLLGDTPSGSAARRDLAALCACFHNDTELHDVRAARQLSER